MLNGYTATKEEMQAYSTELFDLYSKGAFKLATWNDGYPFTVEGINAAHNDLSRPKFANQGIARQDGS